MRLQFEKTVGNVTLCGGVMVIRPLPFKPDILVMTSVHVDSIIIEHQYANDLGWYDFAESIVHRDVSSFRTLAEFQRYFKVTECVQSAKS